jgi:hypothetical protein
MNRWTAITNATEIPIIPTTYIMTEPHSLPMADSKSDEGDNARVHAKHVDPTNVSLVVKWAVVRGHPDCGTNEGTTGKAVERSKQKSQK